MSPGPYCMPLYLHGSLQYFADVRAANNCHSVSRRNDTESSSSSGASLPRGRTPTGAAAASSFNLDACFNSGEG